MSENKWNLLKFRPASYYYLRRRKPWSQKIIKDVIVWGKEVEFELENPEAVLLNGRFICRDYLVYYIILFVTCDNPRFCINPTYSITLFHSDHYRLFWKVKKKINPTRLMYIYIYIYNVKKSLFTKCVTPVHRQSVDFKLLNIQINITVSRILGVAKIL